MEKHGMDSGRKLHRAGLLMQNYIKQKCILCTITLFLSVQVILSAEDKTPVVRLETYPEIPIVGEPWTITLFVDSSFPDEIAVHAPPFSGGFTLDRIIKRPYFTGTQTETVVEYRLIPNRRGRFILDSFIIVCRTGITETNAFVVETQLEGNPLAEQQRTLTLQLVWEGYSRQMPVGERIALVLRTSSSSFGFTDLHPPQSFFAPTVPPGVILAQLPLSESERAEGIAVKLNLIPVEAGEFRLPEQTLQYENIHYEIPSLHIRITDREDTQREVRPENPAADNSESINFNFAVFDETNISKKPTRWQMFFYGFLFLPVIIAVFICYALLKKGKR